jgi:hypothetical protein
MEYCEAHGYFPMFREYENLPNAKENRDIETYLGFKKIELLLDIFKHHPNTEYVYFSDCDVLTTNMRISIESLIKEHVAPGCDILVGIDSNHLSCGNMILKNSVQVRRYLHEILKAKDSYLNEQVYILQNKPSFLCEAKTQRIMNAYDYTFYPLNHCQWVEDPQNAPGQWHPGDFLVHWTSMSLEDRLKVYDVWKRRVIR